MLAPPDSLLVFVVPFTADHISKGRASRRRRHKILISNDNVHCDRRYALSDNADDLSGSADGLSERPAAQAENNARIISASWPFAIVADGVRSCANARADGYRLLASIANARRRKAGAGCGNFAMRAR